MMIQILDNAGQVIATEAFGPTNGGGGFFGGGKVLLNGVRCQMSCNLTPVVDKATNDSLIARYGGKESADYKAAVLAIRLPLMAQILGSKIQPIIQPETQAEQPTAKPQLAAIARIVFDESGLPDSILPAWVEFAQAFERKNASPTKTLWQTAMRAFAKMGEGLNPVLDTATAGKVKQLTAGKVKKAK